MVCPILNKQKFNDYTPKAYLFQNKNEKIRKNSTSGGFYSAIGEYVIKQGGIVYGAAFNENWIVEHQRATKIEELKKFRRSKYVQSDLRDIFRQVENDLKNDKLVCFSGTPCQVAGLKQYLIKDYENLILVDIMCHSVPSPKVFEQYKKFVLKKMKAKEIEDINFRDKSKYGYKYSMMTVETNNGEYSQGIDTDPYLRAFFGDWSVRPCCYRCKFKTLKRDSDITIWDCFNINEINKKFDDDKGTTRILAQSKKGNELIKKLQNAKIEELNLDIATKNVREMTKSVKYNAKRDELLVNLDDEEIFKKLFPTNFKTKINSYIRKILSITGLYNFVKSNAKRILRK